MVANYPAERTARFDYARSVEKQSRSRHYDSFLVRLWQDEGSDAMLRVEVQHVQAGVSTEAVQVPLEWIVSQISGCLEAGGGAQSTAGKSEDAL